MRHDLFPSDARGAHESRDPHIRNTPNFVSGIGALSAAEKHSASTRRVLALCFAATLNAPIPETKFGVFRM